MSTETRDQVSGRQLHQLYQHALVHLYFEYPYDGDEKFQRFVLVEIRGGLRLRDSSDRDCPKAAVLTVSEARQFITRSFHPVEQFYVESAEVAL